MTEVNKDALRELVAELRSGRRRQGKCALERVTGEQCCLGVACDLFSERLGLTKTVVERYLDGEYTGTYFYEKDGSGSSVMLPQAVSEYLGMPYNGILVDGRDGMPRDVSYFNDTAGFSFLEIADLIEKEYDL